MKGSAAHSFPFEDFYGDPEIFLQKESVRSQVKDPKNSDLTGSG